MKLMIRRIAVFGVTMMMAANLMIAFAQGTESESLGDSDMMPLQTQISYEIDALEDNVSVSGEKTGYSPTPVATNQEIVPEDRGSASIFGVDGNTGASGSGADSGSVPADSVDSSSSGAGGSTGASGGGADSAFIPTDGADSSSSGVDGNTGASGSGADSGSVPADSVDSSSSGEGGSTGASGSNPKDPVPESEKQDDKSLLKPNMNEVQPDNNEKQRSGWVEESGQKYYYDGNGEMQKGLQPIGGYWYYLDEETGALWTSGWKQLSNGEWIWGGKDGVIPYGLNQIEGTWRYIDPNTGYMRVGFIDVYSGGRTYAKDGVIYPGWQTVGGKQYYIDPNTRLFVTGSKTINGVTYKFASDGSLQGTSMMPGWHEINGQKYYYDGNGEMQKGLQPIGGYWYYLDEETGALWTSGWKQLSNGEWIWGGKDGVIPYGLNQIEGTWRYIDPNTGYMRVGFIDVYSGGRTYAKDGVIYPGWQTVGGKQYYIDPNTRLFVTGSKTINGVTYKFASDGSLQGTSMMPGWHEINGQKYYYDGNGEMQKGLQPIGGYWYYLDEETGALWTSGWKQAPKGWLWSDSAGKIPLGFKYLDGYWRYFSTDTGYMQIGFFNTHTGGCSYADADGKITPGWQKINEKFYFLDLNNLVLLRGWVDFNNNRFYYKDDYTGATGAYQIDGKWYYFENEWGALVRNTTVTIGGIQYRVDENGIIQNYQVGEVYGIDVSSHQGVIDWRKVADSGVSFAMIRALTWSNAVNYYVIDPYFEANVRNAKANGIDVGVYLYSYAFSQAEMAEEINFFLNSSELSRLRTDGILFDYPVYIDYEDPLVISNVATKQQRTDIVRYGMILLDQAGYLPGFYTYHSFATNLLDGQQLVEEGYEFWVAHTSATSNPWGASAGIWQYSHNGTVPGIQGNVDLNYAYKNYPSIVNPGGGTIPSPVEDTLSVYDEVSGETVTDSVENILAAIVQNEVGGIPLTGLDAEQLFKAQAVAAHSWILYSQGNGEAYPSVKLAPAGSISQAVKNAVSGVKAYIVAYNGTAACTVYGSASAPQTNSAQDMGWSAQPYLINVSSPYENAFGAAWQDKTNTISLSRMKDNIENKLGISTSGYDPSSWLTNPVYDPQTGYCLRITVCGTVVQGGRFYENCYGLYSPNFMFTYSGSAQSWSFVTRGNGHCVGMSQYGAAGFAQAGYSWQQLLLHYYPGTVLQTL